mmetsp:Transcript_62556/g.116319  ORF Transcript_62556/g.116319 Transcript_62556/m.116319 type:complete len:149 (-) Transcript_62556:232-678(-)
MPRHGASAALAATLAPTSFASKTADMQMFFRDVVQKMHPEMRKLFAAHPKATHRIVELLGAGGYLNGDFKETTRDEIHKFNKIVSQYPEAVNEIAKRLDVVERNGLLGSLTGSGVPSEVLPAVALAPQHFYRRQDSTMQRRTCYNDFL